MATKIRIFESKQFVFLEAKNKLAIQSIEIKKKRKMLHFDFLKKDI